MMTKVPVIKSVEQVKDGLHYKGSLEIARATLDYELKFTIPICKIEEVKPAKNQEEFRSIFQILLKKKDVKIELTNEEYFVFFGMIIPFVVKFYVDPKTHDNSKGLIVQSMQEKEHSYDLGVSVSISMTAGGYCNFPSEVCQMLNAQKFDCKI